MLARLRAHIYRKFLKSCYYEQKHGFQPNMSILDLLFNEGNEAIFFL